MSTITIAIPDERLRQLQEAAARLGVSPEDLVRVSIEDLLAGSDEKFKSAADRVLEKNAELYRRLA
ncbi:MAG: ribbon-helix-helix protein, CopG family [Acidobacteria bacterium]|nr:ribbon-helix-helix protein, CopG family [Acidobacteriota bacterium]